MRGCIVRLRLIDKLSKPKSLSLVGVGAVVAVVLTVNINWHFLYGIQWNINQIEKCDVDVDLNLIYLSILFIGHKNNILF